MAKKRTSALIVLIVAVLCVMIGLLLFFSHGKTYSLGTNLNEQVTSEMSLNDIAGVYSDACVSVIVTVKSPKGSRWQVLGSGVCVASNSYITGLDYTASRGSYYVTNYHVISEMVDPMYSGYTTQLQIETDSSDTRYSAKLLWSNKALDMAIIYCDDVASGYVQMKDRVVNCEEDDKLKYDAVFTIGTPLSLQYKNTFSKGYISNKNTNLVETTQTTLYSNDNSTYTTDGYSAGHSSISVDVYENVYENTVLMNVDITNGNSGGGVFDGNGYLIGLSTLAIGYENAGTASLNFMVPIYPAMQVLDKLIVFNEHGGENVFDIESRVGTFIDANEAYYFRQNTVGVNYYKDGKFYPRTNYANAFLFNKVGVIVVDSACDDLQNGEVITSVTINGESHNIKTRNDLIFLLISCSNSDEISFNNQLG